MAKFGTQNLITLGLAAGCIVYFLSVFVPVALNTRVVGFEGTLQGERFVVSRVWRGSPADAAGIQRGDVVRAKANTATAILAQTYRTDLRRYLEDRYRLRASDITYSVERDSERLTLSLMPRELTAGEMLTHYGFRVGLIVFLVTLAVFIVASKSRERSAFIVCLCFCFAALWLASDEPYWPSFFSPLIAGAPPATVYFNDLLEFSALQLVMGTLVHIALVFPVERPIVKHNPWILYPAYLVPLVIPALVVLFSSGDLMSKTTEAYVTRLWLNTLLLVGATLLMFVSHRQCRSPTQRERTRWIVISIGIVAAAHIVLWNIPTLLAGEPLVSNYNWLLLPTALIPLSMTLSIANHELFGIRGIIRGRIKLLETLLEREKGMVVSRDQRIQQMTQEIRQLGTELEEYSQLERSGEGANKAQTRLSKLEAQYPELTRIRQELIIGVSKHWEDVFEQAALAARGTTPVIIVGESGTGKTHVARTVHVLSDRKDRVYKEISCAQFEHADPAFALGRLFGIGTGHGLPNVAKAGQPGLLEECDGGTLFLDDFDRLPLNVQDLLLYPLEGKSFEPGIGTGSPRRASIKFLFATNRDPQQLLSEGKLRADVYARIGARVDLPPLRERSEDVPALVEHFAALICKEFGHEINLVSPKAMKLLSRYSYTEGNARELKSEIQKAIGRAMLENDSVLRAGYLSEKLRPDTFPSSGSRSVYSKVEPASDAAATVRAISGEPPELTALRKHRFRIVPAEEQLGLSHRSRTLSNHLRGICLTALSQHDWDVQRAALWLVQSDDPKTIAKLEGKMRRYIKNIEDNLRNRTESKLFNNLPAAYHEALTQTIAWVTSHGI